MLTEELLRVCHERQTRIHLGSKQTGDPRLELMVVISGPNVLVERWVDGEWSSSFHVPEIQEDIRAAIQALDHRLLQLLHE